jgi:hypothetical protein
VTGAEIIALVTGLPAVISAVTALVVAIRSSSSAKTTTALLNAHLMRGE